MSEHTVGEAIRDYLRLRAAIADINAATKERVTALKATQANIATFIERERVAQGVENFRTAEGTAFQQRWDAVKVVDWDTFLPWLLATGNYQMLTRSVSKEAVVEFMAETKTIPPGLQYDHGLEIRVRKGTK